MIVRTKQLQMQIDRKIVCWGDKFVDLGNHIYILLTARQSFVASTRANRFYALLDLLPRALYPITVLLRDSVYLSFRNVTFLSIFITNRGDIVCELQIETRFEQLQKLSCFGSISPTSGRRALKGGGEDFCLFQFYNRVLYCVIWLVV